MRISKVEYYLKIARVVAERSSCLRRKYGSVIVNHDQIISTGFNGAPRGTANCSDSNWCYKKQNNVPHGVEYIRCESVHSEQNAIIHSSRSAMLGGTLYIAGIDYDTNQDILSPEPCTICMRMIINSGIESVITWKNLEAASFSDRYNVIDIHSVVNSLRKKKFEE